MDIFTPEKRSEIMSKIRAKNTKPEILVRKFLYSKGFRYRLNVANLPGRPDIVINKYQIAIFIHGCFWHGHKNCKLFKYPKTNSEFWKAKIKSNRIRDLKNYNKLEHKNWNVIVIWGCELKPLKIDDTLKKTYDYLLDKQNLMQTNSSLK